MFGHFTTAAAAAVPIDTLSVPLPCSSSFLPTLCSGSSQIMYSSLRLQSACTVTYCHFWHFKHLFIVLHSSTEH